MAAKTNPVTPATAVPDIVDPWDIDVTFESRVGRDGTRPVVEVPDKVMTLVTNALDSGNWIRVPIKDAADFETRANQLHSAGVKLNEGRAENERLSVLTVPGIIEDGKFLKTELKVATHLRATVGRRRGKNKASAPTD